MKQRQFIQLVVVVLVAGLLFSCGKNKVDEAYELKDLGLVEQAVGTFQQAIGENPKDAEAYFGLANALSDQKKFLEAQRFFEDAIKLNPQNPRYKINFLHSIHSYLQSSKRKRDDNYKYTYQLLLERYKGLYHPSLLGPHESSKYAALDPRSCESYLVFLAGINKIYPFTDWQEVYSDPATKKRYAEFCFISEDIKYTSSDGKNRGNLSKGSVIEVSETRNDSVYFIDQSLVEPAGQGVAWMVNGVLYADRTGYINSLYLSVPGLFMEPYCPPALDHLIKRSEYGDVGPLGEQISSKNIDSLSIVRTGKMHETWYSAEYNDDNISQYRIYWGEVTFTKMRPVTMNLPLGQGVYLLDPSFRKEAMQLFGKIDMDEVTLKKVLQLGLVARNMTTDLIINKVTSLSRSTLKYNRDNIEEILANEHYEFIFHDGLLNHINRKGAAVIATK